MAARKNSQKNAGGSKDARGRSQSKASARAAKTGDPHDGGDESAESARDTSADGGPQSGRAGSDAGGQSDLGDEAFGKQTAAGQDTEEKEDGRREQQPEEAVSEQAQAREAKTKEARAQLARAEGAEGESGPGAEELDEDKQPARQAGFPIVGIGSSAGGLEALQEFFKHAPDDTGFGYIVVTHQHPGHVSLLPDLLAKTTGMPVEEALDGTKVEPNHVYVAPSSGLLEIENGVLRMRKEEDEHVTRFPVDHFFRSLAGDQRENAICIVLSGTGSDGTLGVRAIKAEGGLAVVQKSPSARYAGMPSSAEATGLADYALAPAEMPRQLVAYVRGLRVRHHVLPLEPPEPSKNALKEILAIVRSRVRHDFTEYKTSTIRRRIVRRMNVHQITDPDDYLNYLRENPAEARMLFSELLVSVTSFFRDPEAFEAMAGVGLRQLVRSHEDGSELRAWVAGCATGEEAYSVAILISECMHGAGKRLNVQVFATDLDARAIERARAGRYPGDITQNMPKERLDRYFVRDEKGYRVRKEIREMLVFAPHNVLSDPPFTRLDLVVCRNLLIYLEGGPQKQLLKVFHYALRPGGLLFLGPSESIGPQAELFETLHNKWKVFRRKDVRTPGLPGIDLAARRQVGAAREMKREHGEEQRAQAGAKRPTAASQIERVLLERFAPAAVVADEDGSIVYIHGRTGAYLEPTQGEPRANVVDMARQGLDTSLASAMHRVAAGNPEVKHENVRVKTNGDYLTVDLTVSRIKDPEPVRGLILITFQPPTPRIRKKRTKRDDTEGVSGREKELELELQYARESHQTTVEELETSNEELQSTNEELETSKEEMHSLNEELTTVNNELQARVDDLSRTRDDMQNLLNSTELAVIFLDANLRVKSFTEKAKSVVSLIESDVGRPLSDLASNLQYDRLAEDCREVLNTLVRKETEVRTKDGAWQLMRIIPYRTSENVIDGVVITFADIGYSKQAREQTDADRALFESMVRTVRGPLVVLDGKHTVVKVNRAFCQTFDLDTEQVEGVRIYDIDDGQWNISRLHELLDTIIRRDTSFDDFRVEHEFPRVGRKAFLLNARRLQTPSNREEMILLAMEEIESGT
ncbi:MAG: PAS domain-containing protein [Chitinivibrionales bacterium]|nr:PAS domain-containing protein [Chitinivibrionales bacterium]